MQNRPFIIGIAGPSCSGKTELATCLAFWVPSASPVVIHLDSYYRDLSHLGADERDEINFDLPEAIDWNLAIEQVATLAQGGEIEKPVYDFSTHTRFPFTENVCAGDLMIVEGLFALHNEQLREHYDLSIFIDLDTSVCLGRRLQRDIGRRGRTVESIIAQYIKTVRPMYERHVMPTKHFADIVVRGEQSVEKSAARIQSHLNDSFRFQASARQPVAVRH